MKNKINIKTLYILLAICIIIFISIIVVVIYNKSNNNKIIKYDDSDINKIINYLNIDSRFYSGIVSDMNINYDGYNFSQIDNLYINKQIASYVITNVVSNSDYDKNKCNDCYKYFSDDDDIRFYDKEDIDNIYQKLFQGDMRKITQEDEIGFNIIYYNKDIDMYYINISSNSNKKNYASILKEYNYNEDILYIDYYYTRIEYGDVKEEDISNIYLYNIDDIMVKEMAYNDLFNEDNEITSSDDNLIYFDVIRYEFKYNYDEDVFELNRLMRVENK